MSARRASVWFAAGALAALSGCPHATAPDEGGEGPSVPTPVSCAAARAGIVNDVVSLRGVIAVPPDRDALVAPVVAGRIVDIAVHEGDQVRRGDLVARTEDPALAAGVIDASARVAAATASADAAHAALARAERLLAEGIVARRDVEEARANAAGADSEVASARGTRGLASAQRGRARLTAPIDGVVVHLLRRVGELADGTPATPVVEIADLSVLELVGNVEAAELVRLALESLADVTADALPREHFAGHVRTIAPTIDPATSLGEVRIALDAGARLRLGMAGAAAITAGQPRAAVLVRANAVRRAADGHDEVVVCEGTVPAARARVQTVELGARTGDEIEIVSGLRVGTLVVTAHAVGLDDGRPLVVTVTGPAAP